MFPELPTHAGSKQHCAAYLEDTDRFKVELVGINSPGLN